MPLVGVIGYLLFVGGFDSSNLLLSFRKAFGQKCVVLDLLLFLGLETALLERMQVTATLETLWRHQPLDLWGLEVRPGILLLRALNLPPHNILPDVVLLCQVEEFSDLGRPLRAESLWESDIGQPFDLLLALLDDNEGENGNVWANNAPAD